MRRELRSDWFSNVPAACLIGKWLPAAICDSRADKCTSVCIDDACLLYTCTFYPITRPLSSDGTNNQFYWLQKERMEGALWSPFEPPSVFELFSSSNYELMLKLAERRVHTNPTGLLYRCFRC